MKIKYSFIILSIILTFISAFSYSAEITVVSNQTSFCSMYNSIYSLTTGVLGKTIAISMVIISIATAVAQQSSMNMVSGLAASAMMLFGPSIMAQIAVMDGSCKMVNNQLYEVVDHSNKISTPSVVKSNKKEDKGIVKGMEEWSY